jgi:hypothetical protein
VSDSVNDANDNNNNVCGNDYNNDARDDDSNVRNAAVESESDSDDDSKPTKVKRRRTVDKTQTKRTPTNAVSKKTKKVAHWL